MAKAPAKPGLLTRLKQHHMFRVASWYATAAYVLILVANAVFPDVGFTREEVRYVIAVMALGFPVALTLGWIFIPPSRANPREFNRWKHVRWRLGSGVSIAVTVFVAVSGTYLWQLNANFPAGSTQTDKPDFPSVVVLPFDHIGSVDPSITAGLQGTIERTLAGLGSVHVISHIALRATASGSSLEAARSVGATFVIQGSIQRADAQAPFTVQADLLSVATSAPVFSFTDTYAPAAPPLALEQQIASRLAGPVRFQSRPDEWLARGFRTTSNPQALQLLRQALMAYYYGGSSSRTTLAQEAVDLDPSFAQAHAYLAYFILSEDQSEPSRKRVQDELLRAEHLVPGLPEAGLARGAGAWFTDHDATVLGELAAVEDAFPKNFLLHYTLGRELHYRERDDEALKEILTAASIDPFQPLTTDYAARIDFFRRDYESADRLLAEDEAIWPLSPWSRLYRAMVAFADRGDVPALAWTIDGDWSAYRIEGDWLTARQIEVAHLEGHHDAVLKLLAAYPHEVLENTRFFNIRGMYLSRDSFGIETLRLLGRDADARRQAALRLPQALAAMQNPVSSSDLYRLRVAQLQAFGGKPAEALNTVAPILARLRGSESSWAPGDHLILVETAAILAWSGEKSAAIGLLERSLSVSGDSHAAVMAKDPVWRPLYNEPAFVKLLAEHGQKLAYAH